MRFFLICKIIVLALVFFQTKAQAILLPNTNNTGKVDTMPVAKPLYKIVPKIATYKSAILPGYGQIYNRQYWKVPFVYGGLGLSVYYIITNNNKYLKYKTALASFYDSNLQLKANEPIVLVTINGITRQLNFNQILRRTDFYRRNRDYSYLALAGVWVFNIIDANVSAHLKTFDLSDDISFQVKPTLNTQNDFNQLTMGLKFTFNLN
ncbi:MAG: hypothetical protein KA327_04705 [Pseudarcicella sp.]|nr:hypothetical protein [Pseudarcicella sp.]